ncbi:DNA polymerase subunit gamma-2, mitochondrial [Drosophila tropicalis]|uniref:DNA polymerase subunit gamma-2, mitochondrial n=1 Tax=Drosophila tropicalis TaxID=46794 RepID=UPI0035ABDD9F
MNNSRLSRCLKSLESSGYLSSKDQGKQMKLLEHGQRYAKMLKKQWLDLRPLGVYMGCANNYLSSADKRFSFMQMEHFSNHFHKLGQKFPRKFKCPAVIKHEISASNTLDSQFTSTSCNTHLITDFLVQPQRGLEHFYNIQRESKIWWMRSSSNPSRYRIVPYELAEGDDRNGQAIDIKAFFDADHQITIEHLTLVNPKDEKFKLPHAKTGEIVLPTVIRSSIPLEIATRALLLDGCDHNRETQSLLLNRLLAPYQCAIACLESQPSQLADLKDLCQHFRHILGESGLRLCQGDGYSLAKDQTELLKQHQKADMLGVPYTLILHKETLQNGLLQLRSRDTKLEETIHISDVPDYLLNIFKN